MGSMALDLLAVAMISVMAVAAIITGPLSLSISMTNQSNPHTTAGQAGMQVQGV